MTSFDLSNAHEWASEFGTPLYVYHAPTMESQYQQLLGAFDPAIDLRLHYACKALSNISVLKLFQCMGAGLDTVSIEEVYLGLEAGFSPEDILFTPNGVSMNEIAEAVSLGVQINIDNLNLLEQFANRYGSSVPVCVRINPHIMAGGNHKISVGHIDSKFGISIHQVRHLQRIAKNMNLNIVGLHMHTGSDILSIDAFMRGADVLMDIAHEFPNLTYLDFGSGFKVGYAPNDPTTNISALGKAMSERFTRFCEQYGSNLKLIFEPGKFLVSEAGVFITQVNNLKTTPSTVFAQVNSGFNHFGRPMMYDAYHHISNLSNPEGDERLYDVVGYICETDTFGYDRKIPQIQEGDLLGFHNAGAYCSSMSSHYNSRRRPAEVMIAAGQAHLIRERDTIEDTWEKQVDISAVFSNPVEA